MYIMYPAARTNRIAVAVAGFIDADLSVETQENRLTIRGEKPTSDEE